MAPYRIVTTYGKPGLRRSSWTSDTVTAGNLPAHNKRGKRVVAAILRPGPGGGRPSRSVGNVPNGHRLGLCKAGLPD